MAGWQRSIRRPPRPKDNNRDNVNEHRDDNDKDDNDDHRKAVETNAGKSDGDECYLALFANTRIRYVVSAMV